MRVKRGVTRSRRHKKLIKGNKGYFLSYSKLYKRAREASLHAGEYSFAHRRKRQGQFRKVWIKRINAVCKAQDTTYSRFMNNLKKAEVKLDRKVLGFLAYYNQPALEKLISETSGSK
ncbi:MAG: 50S ribosomal protein L20 [Candidatus Dojkabacteria bacterium]